MILRSMYDQMPQQRVDRTMEFLFSRRISIVFVIVWCSSLLFILYTKAGKGGANSLIIGSGETADEDMCFSLTFPTVSMGFEAASQVRHTRAHTYMHAWACVRRSSRQIHTQSRKRPKAREKVARRFLIGQNNLAKLVESFGIISSTIDRLGIYTVSCFILVNSRGLDSNAQG